MEVSAGTISWIVVGAESGKGRRECKMEWIESIVQQCDAAGVPVWVKQVPYKDGVTSKLDQFPTHLRRRELPEVSKTESRGE